jgi:hypothetical protein
MRTVVVKEVVTLFAISAKICNNESTGGIAQLSL